MHVCDGGDHHIGVVDGEAGLFPLGRDRGECPGRGVVVRKNGKTYSGLYDPYETLPQVVAATPGGQSLEAEQYLTNAVAAPIPDALWSDLKAEKLLRADAPTPA